MSPTRINYFGMYIQNFAKNEVNVRFFPIFPHSALGGLINLCFSPRGRFLEYTLALLQTISGAELACRHRPAPKKRQCPRRPMTIVGRWPRRPMTIVGQCPRRPMTIVGRCPRRPMTIVGRCPRRPMTIGGRCPRRPMTIGGRCPRHLVVNGGLFGDSDDIFKKNSNQKYS